MLGQSYLFCIFSADKDGLDAKSNKTFLFVYTELYTELFTELCTELVLCVKNLCLYDNLLKYRILRRLHNQ